MDRSFEKYLSIRNQTEKICKDLCLEDYIVQPSPEVSPPKWHLAHTTWFFEEFILAKDKSYKRFNEKYAKLFNSYYKSMGEHWIQGNRGQLSRPTIQEILDYRQYVDKRMEKFVGNKLIDLGLHHEQQHQELLYMDIKYILGANPLVPKYFNKDRPKAKKNVDKWKKYSEGLYDIGADNGFCFDNETPKHKKYLYSFEINEGLVTNGQYLEFILDGGYKNPRLWLSDGFDWISKHHPLYWNKQGKKWFEFGLYGNHPLDLKAPVSHISLYEADAFARWKKARLPTEEELEIYFKGNKSSDLWCWSTSHYSPYPGFRPLEGNLGEYDGKFMCNQFVLRGGCRFTPKGHLRPTYRNFFRANQSWMFSGIKLARDL